MNFIISAIERQHQRHIVKRRIRILAARLSPLFPENATILDVGCGDGEISAAILAQRNDITIKGLEVQVRDSCAIQAQKFNGGELPFENQTFDAVLFVDVLHHADDIPALLREAQRVARKNILIKDHLNEGLASQCILQFMDDIGNRRHGVASPGHYLTRAAWKTVFSDCKLAADHWDERLGLYPFPLSLIFDRSLHFIARLEATH